MPPAVESLWRSHYALDPWGEERADWRAAMVSLTTARGLYKRADGQHHELEHFMPRFYLDEEEQRVINDRRLAVKMRAALLSVNRSRTKP